MGDLLVAALPVEGGEGGGAALDGPPLDGLDYLRRVRMEATQCPDIVVAKVQQSDFDHKKTSYGPKQMTVPECSPDCLPPPKWRERFVSRFLSLRDYVRKAAESNLGRIEVKSSASDTKWRHFLYGGENKPWLSLVASLDEVMCTKLLECHLSWLRETQQPLLLDSASMLWIFAVLSRLDDVLPADDVANLRALSRLLHEERAKCQLPTDAEFVSELNCLIVIISDVFGQPL